MLEQAPREDFRAPELAVPSSVAPNVVATNAVVLAAGAGTRLRVTDNAPPKPLTPVLGRTLIERSIDVFCRAGVQHVTVVVGADGEQVAAALDEIALPRDVRLTVVVNPAWERGNGTSARVAADSVDGPFFLAMGDHLFDAGILEALATHDRGADLSLAVDYAWREVPDLDEATKVRLNGCAIVDIGKDLAEFDAVDTGIFLCRPALFDALNDAQAAEDHSLSGAVKVLAERGDAMAAPVTGQFWQDVDTPADLELAERRLRRELIGRLRPHAPDARSNGHADEGLAIGGA